MLRRVDDVGATSPRLFTTHHVSYDSGTVTKQFRSWGRAESAREWQALNLLATHAPGLAPAPISADLSRTNPVITMSRLPGCPLGQRDIADVELDAVAEALDRLHHCVPGSVLASIDETGNLRKVEDTARRLAAAGNTKILDPAVRDACRAGLSWLDTDWVVSAAAGIRRPVFAQGDGNLANFLWDDREARIVDFEDSGKGDLMHELAGFTEHLAVWTCGVDAGAFLDRFDLTPVEKARSTQLRRLFATCWLMMLLPGGPSHRRNPPGTLDRQAARLLALLQTR